MAASADQPAAAPIRAARHPLRPAQPTTCRPVLAAVTHTTSPLPDPLLPPPPCPLLQTEMPYDYYSMPFCKPPEGVRRATSTINPGTILLGIRIENSPYHFTIMVSQCAGQPGRAGQPVDPASQAGSIISQPMQPAIRLALRDGLLAWPACLCC